MESPSGGLRTVKAVRYVTPLRSGGSVPGVVEADDLGTYVVKFTGSAQGRKALVAEVIVGELARRLGLRVPELVLVDFDPAAAANEPHQEVQDLLHASTGLNLGMDYLPGATDYTPNGPHTLDIDPTEAARIIWLDAFTANVDRTTHSPNLITWPTSGHQRPRLWLIDHGAALVFHHRWNTATNTATKPYDLRHHALGPHQPQMAAANAEFTPLITTELLHEVLSTVPDTWLTDEPGFTTTTDVRNAYITHLTARAKASTHWLPTEFPPPTKRTDRRRG
ncbi:HipA family kinase [Streptomyces noursei]|uniref:HipA family kinase n=1 Tax=Streptomyces noursei TaxID=1971 RepID=UPI0035D95952